MTFPNGEKISPHQDFRVVAAANTWGNGANRIYCGRNELDGASLNRFIPVEFNYDIALERKMLEHQELLHFFGIKRFYLSK